MVDVSSGAIEEFSPQQLRQFEQAVWLPDNGGIAVVARENQKFFQIWRLSYPEGRLTKITNDLNIYRNLSMSSDGKRLVAGNQNIFSHVWTAPGEQLEAPTQKTFGSLNRDGTIGMTWLPDGSVVYSARDFGNVDIWREGPDEFEKVQLTREAGDVNSYPVFDPTHDLIYFSSNRTGSTQVWRMRTNGDEQTQITFGETETNEFPQISPDGKTLYFIRKSKTGPEIWKRSLADNKEQRLDVEAGIKPSSFLELSADGKFIATSNLSKISNDTGEPEKFRIVVLSTEERSRPRIFELSSTTLAWSPTSNELYFASNERGDAASFETLYRWRRARPYRNV